MTTAAQPRPVMLAIMDGWGLTAPGPGNGVARANTPHVDEWSATCPYTTLQASGMDVGLPVGQIGNSEVGHLNIGGGAIVYQDYTRINVAIAEGDFFTNEGLLATFNHARANNSRVHLLGLFGPGGVHSHQDHLHALLEMAQQQQFSDVYLHLFLDGRDVLPRSALGFLDNLEATMQRLAVGTIATVSGRYYAMDRDRRWERTGLAYEALVAGTGATAPDARTAIEQSYANDVSDEFVLPTVLTADGAPVATIGDNDAVIFYNFRPDRGRQLTRLLLQDDINDYIAQHYAKQRAEGQQVPATIWQRSRQLHNLYLVTMTRYEADFPTPVAFAPHNVAYPLARVISDAGLRQFHIAETEKYPHVTFFFNGRREEPFTGEDRVLIDSPKVATYDLQPEMSAAGVTEALLQAVNSGDYDLIIVNYANPDMVGHTGVQDAIVTACETVDRALGVVVPAVQAQGGAVLIIADHGNAETMLDPETGGLHTAHTTNPVPCILVAAPDTQLDSAHVSLRDGGRLADVAPTLLDLLGVAPPADMTGRSLLVRR